MSAPKWRFRALVNRDRASNDIAYQIDTDAEPIASVAFRAHRISQIGLALVVERHDLGIRDERLLMFVLDLDDGPREYEQKLRACLESWNEGWLGWHRNALIRI